MVERKGQKTITKVFFWSEIKNVCICNPTVFSTLSLQPGDLELLPFWAERFSQALLQTGCTEQCMASDSWVLSSVDKNNEYKTWHERMSRSLMAQVTRTVCRMPACHLCTLYLVLTISTGRLLSETSDLLKTAKQRSTKYWRIKKINPSNCLHSLKQEMWNKVFFFLS